MRPIRHFLWRHFTRRGRNYWRDLYMETIAFYDQQRKRADGKSAIIRELRHE